MGESLLLAALHDYEHAVGSSTALKLLRADNAAVYAAIFRTRFMDGEPVLSGPRFTELVAQDLRAIRASGGNADVGATERIAGWVRDGYLVRTVVEARAVEQYQLSTGAVEAISLLNELVQVQTTATESTMSLMVEQLLRLDADSNPDPAARVAALREEQTRLQRRIDAIQAGEDEGPSQGRVLERLNAVRALGAKVPIDVARHRDNIRQLDRQIRAAARDSDGTYLHVLTALFDGEDTLADTEESRTFALFLSYLMDPRLRDRLAVALDNIRARGIPGADQLLQDMDDFFAAVAAQAHEVKTVQSAMNRALRKFIQTREYLAQRALRDALADTHALAHNAYAAGKPSDETGLNLDMRAVSLRSVASFRLKSRFSSAPAPVGDGQQGGDAFAAEMAALYPVNRVKLATLVNDVLDAAGGAATCGEIVAAAGTPLHLGEVLFLCQTAFAAGMADPDGFEDVSFVSRSGPRTLRVPYFLMTEHVELVESVRP